MTLFSLANKVALVTGGNGGIGRALALGMQEAGARVVVTGRNADKNTAVAAELAQDGAVFALDVRDEAAVEQVIAAVMTRFGRLDILVNNAGVGGGGPMMEMSREDWDDVMAVNLTGSFLCAKHAARAMTAQGRGGKIINIGSMYSVFGPDSFVDYGASKTAVLGLTRGLAVELAQHNIQVNAILPGWIVTDLTQEIYESDLGERIRRKTPAGRWGADKDIVGTGVFLAAAASDFVTGTAIPVDGGYLVTDRFVHG